MITEAVSAVRSAPETQQPEVALDPEPEQKWEKTAPASGIVPAEMVITAVHDGHVSYRSMADNEPRSMTLDELRRDWEFVETVEFDEDDDWSLP